MGEAHRINGHKKTVAVITAAGKGSRMHSHINKQYIEIAGIPVLARSTAAFQHCPGIDEIILVVNEQDIDFCRENIVEKFCFSKVTALVSGGSERQYSVFQGLSAIEGDCGIVLIHDGARPFVSEKNILDCISDAIIYGACGVGVRLKDTIKISDKDGFVVQTPERSSLWSIQTPQAFEYKTILEAHKKALEESFVGTDDMMLVERTGSPVKIIEGSYNNIKITTPEDIPVGETILKGQFNQK